MNINIPWLSARLALWGLPEKTSQIIEIAVAAVFALGLCIGIKVFYDHQIITKHEAQANVKVLQNTIKANDVEAQAMASDVADQQVKDNARVEAIAQATETTPSDPSRRLGCERLHEAGYDTGRIPACKFD